MQCSEAPTVPMGRIPDLSPVLCHVPRSGMTPLHPVLHNIIPKDDLTVKALSKLWASAALKQLNCTHRGTAEMS